MTDVTTLPKVITMVDTSIPEIIKWATTQGLVAGENWHFLGYHGRKQDRLAFAFSRKDIAMLFKLTFGGD